MTGSRGRAPLVNGERFSYALGGGNYLILEEVEPPASIHQTSSSNLLQARDLTKDLMAIEHSPSKVSHLFNSQ